MIINLNSINRFVFLKETGCVHRVAGTEASKISGRIRNLIYGGQSGTGTRFAQTTLVSLSVITQPMPHTNFHLNTLRIGRIRGRNLETFRHGNFRSTLKKTTTCSSETSVSTYHATHHLVQYCNPDTVLRTIKLHYERYFRLELSS